MALNDPNYSSRVLGLHFEGANNSTTLVDSSSNVKTISVSGTAKLTTSTFKYGLSSLALDGSSNCYVNVADSSDFDTPGLNFTIHCWAYWSSTPSANSAVFTIKGLNWEVYRRPSSGHSIVFYDGSTNAIVGTTAISNSNWHHIALVGSNGTVKLYLNGVSQGSSSKSTNLTTTGIVIGAYSDGTERITGFIDEFYFNTVSIWTSDFAPPTDRFFDGTHQDVSSSISGVAQNPIGFFKSGIVNTGSIYATTQNATSLFNGFVPVSGIILSETSRVVGGFSGVLPTFFNVTANTKQPTGFLDATLYQVIKKGIVTSRKYIASLSGNGVIEIPISSINSTMRSTGSISCTVVAPDGLNYANEILIRKDGTLSIKSVETFIDGTVETKEQWLLTNLDITYSRGSNSFSITIQGSANITLPSLVRYVYLSGISYMTLQSNGARRVRCELNKDLLPKDFVVLPDGSNFSVDIVQHIITTNTKAMEVAELV